MSREKISAVLSSYLPAESVETCSNWIVQKNIHLKISKVRASKFGDYMPLPLGKGHRITVNHNLNQYAFLITFVHEVAHLHTHNKYKKYHEPHGKEWKQEFRVLLSDFIVQGIFPEDIKSALIKYVSNPAASSCTDINLFRTLKKYDSDFDSVTHLEDIPESSLFRLINTRQKLLFKKGHKIRSRFHCIEQNSDRIFFVSPMAEVEIIG
jgi:SprT protein